MRKGAGNLVQRYPRCFSALVDDRLPDLAPFPAPSAVFGDVAVGLFSTARPPQVVPGAFVKHRSKGRTVARDEGKEGRVIRGEGAGPTPRGK